MAYHLSSSQIPIAGAIAAICPNFSDKKITVFKSWKLLFSGSVFLAAAVFLWYDSVTRVGATKEGLLAGPLEAGSSSCMDIPEGKIAKKAARWGCRSLRFPSNSIK